MVGSRFMTLPMHGCCVFIENLHPVHTCICTAGFRMSCVYHRKRNKTSTIVWPAFQNRKDTQVGYPVNYLLAFTSSSDSGWKKSCQFKDGRQC